MPAQDLSTTKPGRGQGEELVAVLEVKMDPPQIISLSAACTEYG
jgi:hypothetical protein